ncbi:helix-turn-helix domain-containing protein [Nocardia wallacei]|uniref:Transcriptional regulator n=1 Tax=Nocardia wallacei TaxID=480035 RepID=A0A7G1KWP5_9NOCA|nr:helix-turn-helix transcriptional regulator [Nocardia wallacei]BCK58449.1 transcriptional regulator [Nocardia wallacei]
MSENGSTLPRRQLGRYLRNGREECGLTLQQVGTLIRRSASTVQRIEKGMVANLREEDLDALCRIYEFDADQTAAMKILAAQGNVLSWWQEFGDLLPANFDFYVGLEAAARGMTTYQSELVPGLLQIPAYASALMHAVYPDDSSEEHERRVRLRMRRQIRITRKAQPICLDVVLRESALRGMVGGPRVMAAQLKHLADVGTRPNVNLRVLPFSAGFPLGVAVGPFVLLEFGSDATGEPLEPPVVYVENFAGDLYLEKHHVVRRYHQAYESIRSQALDAVASRNLLRQLAKEYA